MANVNPVGNSSLKHVEEIVKDKLANWENYVHQNWPNVVHFFLISIEDGAKSLDQSGLLNADKKATLLATVSNLYDTVVSPLLPIYLRPFSGYIKTFLINTVLNVFVDYIVGKIHQLENLNSPSKAPPTNV